MYNTSLGIGYLKLDIVLLVLLLKFKGSVSWLSVQNLSQNAKRASARKDTGLDQSLFSVQLFRLRINIMKVCKGSI